MQLTLFILLSAEEITKSFRHILFLPPHLSIWLPLSRDFLHIKRNIILNKFIRIVRPFKEECLLSLRFSQLQRVSSLCSLIVKCSLEVVFLEWASDLSSSTPYPMCQTSSVHLPMESFPKLTLQGEYAATPWDSLRVTVPRVIPQIEWPPGPAAQLYLLQVAKGSRAHWQLSYSCDLS